MDSFTHRWDYQGRTITFSWMGDIAVETKRVYAIAFSPKGKLLLVGDGRGESDYWLPGGGIEAGETPELALHRELMEEAAATIHTMKRMGVQRVHDPLIGNELTGNEYHAFYYCQITLSPDFNPETEVTERRLVSQDEFLDRLLWGRSDPKAAMLLEKAVALHSHLSNENVRT